MRSASLVWPAAAWPQPARQDQRALAPAGGAMSAALAVLQMAAALEPDPVQAMTWYHSVPIAPLGGLTAAALVTQGRAGSVFAFLYAAIEIDRAERRALR